MITVSHDQMNALINAMQLCIQSVIDSWSNNGSNSISIQFDSMEPTDKKFQKLKKLLPMASETTNKIILIDFDADYCRALTTFLLLTRLEDKNMQKLAAMDSGYDLFLQKLGLKRDSVTSIASLQEATQVIFKIVEERKMTLRELSEKSGLTQAALSNFKTGKTDIRLSSFLKIAAALGLKFKIL